MRTIIVGAAAATLAAATGTAAAAQDVSKTLTDLEARWSAASVNRDVKTIDEIVAPDWIGRNASGRQADKSKLLSETRDPAIKTTAIKNHDVVVRANGDMAVVQGYDDETSSDHGKDISGTYSWTDVFQKRNGRWRAIASQTTKVSAK